jgi:hypothetical protein
VRIIFTIYFTPEPGKFLISWMTNVQPLNQSDDFAVTFGQLHESNYMNVPGWPRSGFCEDCESALGRAARITAAPTAMMPSNAESEIRSANLVKTQQKAGCGSSNKPQPAPGHEDRD